MNSTISRGFVYRKAADRFHQWRFNDETFGLHFGTTDDANTFSQWIFRAIEMCEHPTGPTNEIFETTIPPTPKPDQTECSYDTSKVAVQVDIISVRPPPPPPPKSKAAPAQENIDLFDQIKISVNIHLKTVTTCFCNVLSIKQLLRLSFNRA